MPKYRPYENGSVVYTSVYYDYDLGADDNHPVYPDSSRSFVIFTKLNDSVISGMFEFHGIGDQNIAVDMTNGFFDIKAQ